MRWLGAIVLSVLVIVGLLTLLGQGPAVPGLGLTPPPASDDAASGYAADAARLVQTGTGGEPQYVLTAARMSQDPNSEDVAAQDLKIDYAAPDAPPGTPPWRLTANEGHLPGGTLQMHLAGNVRVVGQPRGGKVPLRVETRALDYDIGTQVISTGLPVNFYWGSRRLNARGINVDLKGGTLRLESSVHGRFPP